MVEEKPTYVGRSFMTDEQRAAILEELPRVGNVLEVGTGHGVTVAWWARRRPRVKFLSVDIFKAAEGTGPGVIQDWLANQQENQHLFVGTLLEFVKYGTAESFDLAFVDAGHSYRDCVTDLDAAQWLVADEGKILVHDYGRCDVANLRGVTKAVDHFCEVAGWHLVKQVVNTAVLMGETGWRES